MTSEPADLVVDSSQRLIGSTVDRCHRLSGGDVAESFRLDLADGSSVFAKTHRNPPPDFFTTEAAGLSWLREGLASDRAAAIGPTIGLGVPEVLACSDDPPVLILEWIDQAPRSRGSDPDGEEGFGRALAALHRSGAPTFGRTDRRTTGSRRLPNDPTDSWSEFYAQRRLLPLAALANDGEALPTATIEAIEVLAGRLARFGGPPEPPARLHGDLWAGNRLIDNQGRHWLIDPASHGGHREFDLAMMRLFGGFGPRSFAAYHEVHPLADGWEDRIALHQLAPLIVHAIKFGGNYRAATDQALSNYR